MKTRTAPLLLLLLGLVTVSCVDWNDANLGTAENLDEINVASDFDWKTDHNIDFIIRNAETGVIKITSQNTLVVYHKGFYSGEFETYEAQVKIPYYEQSIKINGVELPVNGSVITYQFGLKELNQITDNDYSLLFDGNNDYVNIDENELIEEYPFTMAAWVKTSGFSNEDEDMVIMNLADPSESNRYYGIYIDANEDGVAGMKARKGSTKTNVGTTDITDGEWHFIVGVFQSKNVRKLYVDGVLESTGTENKNFTEDAEKTVFGRWGDSSPGSYFNGNIDEVSLWDIALNATQINNYMTTPPTGNENGLVGYWKFDTGSGTTAEDETDEENDGTIHGAQWILDGGSSSDSDGDGVENDEDDYPDDATRAFDNLYPASSYGTLAFEDLWPGKGDYDFNDMVVDYQFKTVTNASNYVVEIFGSFILKAIGASFQNGFGFQFPNSNVTSSNLNVSGSELNEGYITNNANGTESGQGLPTVIVFDNALSLMPKNAGESNVNTDPDETYITPDTVTITMTFTANTYTSTEIGISNFNPFIIVDLVRDKEIHLPDYAPTTLASDTYFGTLHDDSDSGTGRYYKTGNNLPWAINIYESFDYPQEKKEITSAHLKFAAWAQSAGTSFPNWYQDNTGYRNELYIYSSGN